MRMTASLFKVFLCCFVTLGQASAQEKHEATVEHPMTRGAEAGKPVKEEPSIRASHFIDKPVRNPEGQALGFCIDVITDASGRILYLVVSTGGVFYIGTKLIPVPWGIAGMRLTGTHVIVLPVTDWQLKNAPSFRPGEWPDLLSDEWKKNVYGYYGVESRKKAEEKTATGKASQEAGQPQAQQQESEGATEQEKQKPQQNTPESPADEQSATPTEKHVNTPQTPTTEKGGQASGESGARKTQQGDKESRGGRAQEGPQTGGQRREAKTEKGGKTQPGKATEQEKGQKGKPTEQFEKKENIGTQTESEKLKQELYQFKPRQTGHGIVLTLDHIFFNIDRAELMPGARLSLGRLASILKAYSNRDVLIEGFSDSTGRSAYNLKLSERRAGAVAHELTSSGINSERITEKGYGEDFPVATNTTATGRQLNRRVEVTVLNPGANGYSAAR